MFNTKKLAFTITEVLIALAIIGTIAVLTVPKVMKEARIKSDVMRLRNAYTGIEDAVRTAAPIVGYDLRDSTALNNSDVENHPQNVQDFLAAAFNATLKSGDNYFYTASGKTVEWTSEPGVVDEVILQDYSDSVDIATENDLIYVASNGVFYIIKERDFNAEGGAGKPLTLYIDINGTAGPNQIITCTEGEDDMGSVPNSSEGVYVEPAPCVVDDSAVTDIYPFFIYFDEVAPATNAVVAVLEK